MAFTTLSVTENYDVLKILRKAHLTQAFITDIETHINNVVKLNAEQIAKDTLGNSYVYDNDGVANLVTPLIDQAALLADNETVTGSWTFSGTVAYSAAVSSTSTFSSSGQPRSRGYVSGSNQSITDATITPINLPSETYDVASMHDVAVNNERLTVPSGGSGVYSLNAQITFANNATGRREVAIYKNGSKIGEVKEFNPDGTENTVLNITLHDTAIANDYYDVRVFQNSTGALNVILGERVSFFSAMKVW